MTAYIAWRRSEVLPPITFLTLIREVRSCLPFWSSERAIPKSGKFLLVTLECRHMILCALVRNTEDFTGIAASVDPTDVRNSLVSFRGIHALGIRRLPSIVSGVFSVKSTPRRRWC